MGVKSSILKSFKTKDHLAPSIWEENEDGTYTLNPEVRSTLLEVANRFLDYSGMEELSCDINTRECDVYDVTMTGSLANFNWSKFSDIDLHLILDFEEVDDNTELVRNYLNSKKTIWNSTHDITIDGYEVEIYSQDYREPHHSSGVYSVLYNKWLVEPSYSHVTIDEKKLNDKSLNWMEAIDRIVDRSKDVKPETTLKEIENIKAKLKKYRSCGLESGGEYSYENLVFKVLRRNGYIKKLIDLKNKLIDNILTI
mgnify:CR=1 FL=1